MVSEVELLLDQVASVAQDAPGILGGLSDEAVAWRPATERWSIGEHIDHLNRMGELYTPLLRQHAGRARTLGRLSGGPFRYGFLERLAVRYMEPPPVMRTPAPASLAPRQGLSAGPLLEAFLGHQQGFSEAIASMDGLDLARYRMRSPLAPVFFTLGTTVALVLAHERRHLYLARLVRQAYDRRR